MINQKLKIALLVMHLATEACTMWFLENITPMNYLNKKLGYPLQLSLPSHY
jgi:hypothetical protein